LLHSPLAQQEDFPMSWSKAFAAWFFIAVAESIHGVLRRLFVLPVLGDLRAHQLGIVVGCLIIFGIALACIRWIGATTLVMQLKLGAFWTVLMAAFEVGLGLASGYPLERILLDYNISEGRLMVLGMLFMLFAPWLAARVRAVRQFPAGPPQGKLGPSGGSDDT